MCAFVGMPVAGVVLGSLAGPVGWLLALLLSGLLAIGVAAWLTVRFIPNTSAGVVEKLWSNDGSVGEGGIIAQNGEAGFQAALLRGGIHFGLWRWQYRLHRTSLVTIPQGKIGYVYARDGEPLGPGQTLGREIPCNNFQDARTFLGGDSKSGLRGQRGRQLAILREGVYAVNPAIFIVITEDAVYALRSALSRQETEAVSHWREELLNLNGFSPVIIGRRLEAPDPINSDQMIQVDSIAIVTVHDGPSLNPGEIIAPPVGVEPGLAFWHNNYQNPQAFLDGGGRRGKQYFPLTDGTYFINRWFATIELIPKTVVPIGYVGVVVSYFGRAGRDLSGDTFRHGERVAEGERGVWERPYGPGKYAFNTYAGNIVHVPTTNFVLHWITGRTEAHRYDESLRSIDLVTRDAYEPRLPLSVVVHIDYQRAPNVIQRFGDVKRLITQTIDPMLSAYFRDIAHKKTMLELLHERDAIQAEAREELRRKFHEFDIECVDVLIGKPDTDERDGKIETLLEQLRTRQLSIEQLETYERQRAAADKLRVLHESQAQAEMQTQLTNARVRADIAESEGAADLARARKQAEKQVVMAQAELDQSRRRAEQVVMLAEAESRQLTLAGKGEGQKILQCGLAEAAVLMRKISSYGDPRLFALERAARQLARSSQPLVPERVFVSGQGDGHPASITGTAGLLLQMMLADRTSLHAEDAKEIGSIKEYVDRLTQQVMESLGTPDDSTTGAAQATSLPGGNTAG